MGFSRAIGHLIIGTICLGVTLVGGAAHAVVPTDRAAQIRQHNTNVEQLYTLVSSMGCWKREKHTPFYWFYDSYRAAVATGKKALGRVPKDFKAFEGQANPAELQHRLAETSAAIALSQKHWAEFLRSTYDNQRRDENARCADDGMEELRAAAALNMKLADPLAQKEAERELSELVTGSQKLRSVRFFQQSKGATGGAPGSAGEDQQAKGGQSVALPGLPGGAGPSGDVKAPPAAGSKAKDSLLSALSEKEKSAIEILKAIRAQSSSVPKDSPLLPKVEPKKLEAALDELKKDEPARPKSMRPAAPVLPSKDLLIGSARRALEDWKAGRHALADGEFWIQSEARSYTDISEAAYQEMFLKWHEKQGQYRDLVKNAKNDPLAKAQALLNGLVDDYIRNYTRDNARMSDFLRGRGGNCEAQTKLVLAAAKAAGYQPGSSYRLLVQEYTDHIQPVLYDPNTKQAIELISGKRQIRLEAPLFDPAVLYYGYLKGEGKADGFSEKDFLVVDVPDTTSIVAQAKNAINPLQTNTKLRLSAGKNQYNSGDRPVPERTRIGRPDFSGAGGSGSGAPGSADASSGFGDLVRGIWGGLTGSKGKQGGDKVGNEPTQTYGVAATSEEFDELYRLQFHQADQGKGIFFIPDKKYFLSQFKHRSFAVLSTNLSRASQARYKAVRDIYVFANAEDATRFNALATKTQQFQFLRGLVADDINKRLDAEGFQELIGYYEKPDTLTEANVARQSMLVVRHGRTPASLVQAEASQLSNFYWSHRHFDKELENRYLSADTGHISVSDAIALEIADDIPAAKELARAQLNFQKRVAAHPAEFARHLDGLTPADGAAFRNMYAAAWDGYELNARIAHEPRSLGMKDYLALSNAIRDGKVALKKDPRGIVPSKGSTGRKATEGIDVAAFRSRGMPLENVRGDTDSARQQAGERQQTGQNARSGQPGRKAGEGSNVTPSANAAIIKPTTFLQLLGIAMDPRAAERFGTSTPYGVLSWEAEAFRFWTPEVSRLLMKRTSVQAPSLAYLYAIYPKILRHRDPSTFTHAGPHGEKIPEDLAVLLYLAAIQSPFSRVLIEQPAFDSDGMIMDRTDARLAGDLRLMYLREHKLSPEKLKQYVRELGGAILPAIRSGRWLTESELVIQLPLLERFQRQLEKASPTESRNSVPGANIAPYLSPQGSGDE